MKRIVMWLMVAALMAALMAATAVPAFTCGEGAANSGLAKSDPRFGYNFIKAAVEELQPESSEGESIRGNASSCNKGEGPPV